MVIWSLCKPQHTSLSLSLFFYPLESYNLTLRAVVRSKMPINQKLVHYSLSRVKHYVEGKRLCLEDSKHSVHPRPPLTVPGISPGGSPSWPWPVCLFFQKSFFFRDYPQRALLLPFLKAGTSLFILKVSVVCVFEKQGTKSKQMLEKLQKFKNLPKFILNLCPSAAVKGSWGWAACPSAFLWLSCRASSAPALGAPPSVSVTLVPRLQLREIAFPAPTPSLSSWLSGCDILMILLEQNLGPPTNSPKCPHAFEAGHLYPERSSVSVTFMQDTSR